MLRYFVINLVYSFAILSKSYLTMIISQFYSSHFERNPYKAYFNELHPKNKSSKEKDFNAISYKECFCVCSEC